MTTTQQPEAIRLADLLKNGYTPSESLLAESAAELLRLHAENEALKKRDAYIVSRRLQSPPFGCQQVEVAKCFDTIAKARNFCDQKNKSPQAKFIYTYQQMQIVSKK